MTSATRDNPRLPRWRTALVLALACAGPPLIAWISSRVSTSSSSLGIHVALHLLFCSLAVVVVGVVIGYERLSLRSIGLRRPDWSTLVTIGLLGIALWLLPLLTAPLVNAFRTEGLDAGLRTIASWPLWFSGFVAITSGFVEETLYRGYAVERLATITGSRWLGGAISALIFGLAHVPMWGLGVALAADLPFGILMTVFYLWRRDLIANGLVHSAALVVAMVG